MNIKFTIIAVLTVLLISTNLFGQNPYERLFIFIQKIYSHRFLNNHPGNTKLISANSVFLIGFNLDHSNLLLFQKTDYFLPFFISDK
jgi:hypothetical protein